MTYLDDLLSHSIAAEELGIAPSAAVSRTGSRPSGETPKPKAKLTKGLPRITRKTSPEKDSSKLLSKNSADDVSKEDAATGSETASGKTAP